MTKNNSKFFLLFLLGMLTAFGPFVTDMYLPCLPSMAGFFGASTSQVQLGLTFSMLGLALGQVLFGPLSDKYGRRSPLLAAMALFLLSTLACLFSPNIEVFVALRLVQGIAGAGGIVLSRSIATDTFSGQELAKALAIVGAINGVAPVVAPIAGGAMADAVGWRGIFVALLGLGLVLGGCCLHFQESMREENRSKASLLASFKLFKAVLKNKKYLFYVLQMASAQGILFGYIAASPFLIQEHYGFSPFSFSLFFAINAIGIGLGAALSIKFRRQETCVAFSCLGMLACSAAMMAVLSLEASILWFEGVLFAMLFAMGLTFTASTTLAMESARQRAGTASALLGAGGFLVGGLVSPLVGMGNILISTGVTFLCAALASALFALLARRVDGQPAEMREALESAD